MAASVMTACPFCQSREPLFLAGRPDGAYAVECGTCGAQGPAAATGMDAEIAWGQRAKGPPRALPARVCRGCEGVFQPRRPNQLYCTRRCANKTQQHTWRSRRGLRVYTGMSREG